MPRTPPRCLLLLTALVLAGLAPAADWPQWRYDAGRTSSSPQKLPGVLNLHWVRVLPSLRPAWPDQPMMQLDDTYMPVVAGKRLLVGSSCHDTLTAYDTETGKEVWRFQADGPVRYAPAAWENRACFAADDGYLYCVDIATGKLQWKFRGGPSDRLILGNERLISTWPARGGPVIVDGIVYFTAGIWPFMGIFIHAVDARTGKAIWTNDGDSCVYIKQPHNTESFAGVAPQGPLTVVGDRLLVPGGRSVPACLDRKTGKLLWYHLNENGKRGGGSEVNAVGKVFVNGGVAFNVETGKALGGVPPRMVLGEPILHGYENDKLSAFDLTTAKTANVKVVDRKGKSSTVSRWSMDTLGSTSTIPAGDVIGAGDRLYVGGDGEVLAFDLPLPKDGKVQPSWRGEVVGHVGGLLAADDRLFAVTKEGRIYCFGGPNGAGAAHRSPTPQPLPHDETTRKVRALLEVTGIRAGYGIIWGAGDGKLARELVRQSELHLVALDGDTERIRRLRDELQEAGVGRDRLAYRVAGALTVDLPPYLASLMVVEPSLAGSPDVIRKLYQSLRPYGGVAALSVPPTRHQDMVRAIDRLELPGAQVRSAGEWLLLSREGALPGSANWTHEHGDSANTRVSTDRLVKAPLGVLWWGGPSNDGILPRHGHGPQPQVLDGRLFIEGIDMMRAMDVYTGRILWETSLPGVGTFYNNLAHQPGANASGTNFISTPDGIYVALTRSCVRLDPTTGKKLNEFPLPSLPGSLKTARWGYINVVGDYLVGGAEPLYDSATKLPAPDEKTDDPPPPDKKDDPKKEEPKKDDPKKDTSKDPKKEEKKDPLAALKPTKPGIDNYSSSKFLFVLDRRSGKLLWWTRAELGFRHNAICAGGGRLYCIDRLSGAQLYKIKRHGQTPKCETALIAFDLATGKEVWRTDEKVFGTWLSYSVERDVLVEAGRVTRDAINDEPVGMRAYRGSTGEVLWYEGRHAGPAMILRDTILLQGSACELRTGKKKTRPDPLTLDPVEWVWTRNYGCNTPLASEHLLTFRSGAAGYYDLCNDGGTGNLGGFRSSCTNNLIVANGVLSAPDYTRTCTCHYQNQTSLAFVPMPEAEMWTFFGPRQAKGPVRRLGLNFGAPGDRRADNGTLWTEYPSVAGRSPMVPVTTVPARPEYIRRHASAVSGPAPAWVASSAVKGLHALTIELAERNELAYERSYTIRLYFAELEGVDAGERVFDVGVQGVTAIRGLDIVKEAGGRNRSLVREVTGVKLKRELVVTFLPSTTAKVSESILSGIEVIAEGKAP